MQNLIRRHWRDLVVALALLLGALAPSARAEMVAIAGAAGTADSSVAYLGALAPLPGQRFGDGWVGSVFADTVGYAYDGGPGHVEARSYALRAGVARQFALEHGTASAGAFVVARDTQLSPDDPGNESRGLVVRPGVELSWLSSPRTSLATSVYASFTAGTRDYYVLAFGGLRSAPESWAAGPVVWALGGPEYRNVGAGVALRDVAIGPARAGFRLGAERAKDGPTRVLLGVEISLYRR